VTTENQKRKLIKPIAATAPRLGVGAGAVRSISTPTSTGGISRMLNCS